MSRMSPKTIVNKEVLEDNKEVHHKEPLSLENIINNKKTELIAQTEQINSINNANKVKIAKLQKELDNSSEIVTKLTEMENEVKKIIDSHKRTIENPAKTKANIIALEKEIEELNNSAKDIVERCLENMNSYSEFLGSFL